MHSFPFTHSNVLGGKKRHDTLSKLIFAIWILHLVRLSDALPSLHIPHTSALFNNQLQTEEREKKVQYLRSIYCEAHCSVV
jgi:hypothetical protein